MMKKMGSLRRFFMDLEILLNNAVESNDMEKVSKITSDLNKVQSCMKGGKKWSEVEVEQEYLLKAYRGMAETLEQLKTLESEEQDTL